MARRLSLLVASLLLGGVLALVFWDFTKNHPAIILVLIGVVGEVVCEWKSEGDFLEKLGGWFGVILVIGLVWELHEAAKTDHESNEAKERAGRLEHSNLLLREKVAELEAALSPRRIEGALRTNLVTRLRSLPAVGPIIIDSESRDMEVAVFRKQLEAAFAEANIPITRKITGIMITETVVSEGLLFRIKAGEPPPLHAQPVLAAFTNAGVAVVAEQSPRTQSGALEIWVGVKPLR